MRVPGIFFRGGQNGPHGMGGYRGVESLFMVVLYCKVINLGIGCRELAPTSPSTPSVNSGNDSPPLSLSLTSICVEIMASLEVWLFR
jgi:hypothetical protein